jgi:hypothetical protein
MNSRALYDTLRTILLAGAILPASAARLTAAELRPATLKAWNAYVEASEQRIARELRSAKGFLALDFQPVAQAALERQAVLAGEITVKKMDTVDPAGEKIPVPAGMIHHWRGSVFIPGANLEDVVSRVTNPDLNNTRQEDVLRVSVLERGPDYLRIYLKLQRSKFVTVVYNTEHTVKACRYGKSQASSTSVATKIAELEMPNSDREREKPEGQDRGFLWRLNSYWRYEQAAGGVIVECESISLSRGVPALLELVIRPLIDSTARESMCRTLDSMRGRLARALPHKNTVTAPLSQASKIRPKALECVPLRGICHASKRCRGTALQSAPRTTARNSGFRSLGCTNRA